MMILKHLQEHALGLIDLWTFKGDLLVGGRGSQHCGSPSLDTYSGFHWLLQGRSGSCSLSFSRGSSPALLVSPQLPLHRFLFCLFKTISLLPLVPPAQIPKLDSSWRLHPLSPTVLPSFLLISGSIKSCLWLSSPMSLSFFLFFFILMLSSG